MGEYATYRGNRIKIGTCEDMFYLRADQAHLVQAEPGNVDPTSAEDQKAIRFRFPWPQEDGTAPGAFEDFSKAVAVPGLELPGIEFDHHSVQLAGSGYLTSIPCPEGPEAKHGLLIHRNGFPGKFQIVQQAYRNGNLAVIMRCGGCGGCFNLPTFKDVEPVIVACRAQADRETRDSSSAKWWHTVADRIAAGYAVTAPA